MKKLSIIFILTLAINFANAQSVAINKAGNSGNAAAALDLSDASNNALGLLMTNVSIGNVNSASPITSPPDGLIVYNTNASTTGGFGTGFYYWSQSATQWIYLATSASIGNSVILNQVSQQSSSNFNISGAGTLGALLTANLGLTASGAAINLNANSNFNTNINTGSSTGTVSIGNSSSTTGLLGAVNINTSGATSTNIGNSGTTTGIVGTVNINTSGNNNSNIGNSGGTSAQTIAIHAGAGSLLMNTAGADLGTLTIGGAGTTTIRGTLNLNSGTIANTNIGNTASTTAITMYSGSGGVNINTAGTGLTSLGNSSAKVNLPAFTTNDEVFYTTNGNGTIAATTGGTNGNVLTLSGGVPTWNPGGVPTVSSNQVYTYTGSSEAMTAGSPFTLSTTTTTLTQVTGSTLTLNAGTYLITATAQVGNIDGTVDVVLTDGTNYYGYTDATADGTNVGNWSATFKITLGSTTTYKIMICAEPLNGAETTYCRNANINATACQ